MCPRGLLVVFTLRPDCCPLHVVRCCCCCCMPHAVCHIIMQNIRENPGQFADKKGVINGSFTRALTFDRGNSKQ